ncbi:DUF4865 family protein [Amantichitinum ursilacus]|uniref:DUF4865 domain-containing protein n=1 Tax=Amantichitinum ursilacus TaxID=857265 RepID=A0A0N0GPW8_9NEIS|nr:DUF4865 family protein [Amantichitinum ursilacus]KPC53892.1 hypothetical protein WG78_07210 [Amantichitinum ursilacus]
MLAMQYRFVLPADYDMDIIARRIADKGPLLDDFDGLILKAYLSSRRDTAHAPAAENSYAPFYLWQDSAAMFRFLSGPGFKALTQDLGWPIIQTWAVLDSWFAPDARSARYAACSLNPITPYSDLARLREPIPKTPDLLGWISGFEMVTWHQVKFTLWREATLANTGAADDRRWQVGHIAAPALARPGA